LQLDPVRKERRGWLEWKNIAPVHALVQALPPVGKCDCSFGDTVTIRVDLDETAGVSVLETARALKPWRKGPFAINELFIDTEWQSFLKYNLIAPHIDLEGKVVADVGCNNGYYMFRMLEQNPKRVVGFDPSPLTYLQFRFINHFVQSEILEYELLGIEHIEFHEHTFDVIFCLGVLYHRSDPIESLKSLYRALTPGGEIIIDTIVIPGDEELCLFPKDRYAAMRNVYFLPTVSALENWLYRAGFKEIETFALKPTDTTEQRKTEWIDSFSLNNFLQNDDTSKTIEGYPAPIRAYVKARRV
jgi:tRNA (mo5U34)-methyltransferase